MPKRKANTWKSDPRANDHGALLSTALGKRVVVKGTRTEKIQRGVVGQSNEARYSTDELVRHTSSPFEITLVSGIRAEGSIPLVEINHVIESAFEKYMIGAVKFANDNGSLTDQEKNDIHDITYTLAMFAPRLFNTLDTIRCAELANKKYYRTMCVSAVNDELELEIDHLIANTREYYKAKPDLIWTLVVGTLLGVKDIETDVKQHDWCRYLEKVPVEQVINIAKKYVDKCKPENLVDEKDAMYKSLQMTIEIAHLLTPLKRPKGSQSVPEPNPEKPNIKVTGESDNDKESDEGQGYSSVVDRTDFTHAVDFEFNEHIKVQIQKLDEKKAKDATEKAENSKYIGGAITPHEVGAKAKVTVDNTENMVDPHLHEVEVRTFTQEPVKLNASTVNLLQDVEKAGMASRHRTGMPTPDVWQIKRLGNTRVFGKAKKKSGKLLMMIDCSGSMGDGYRETDNGYLAYQASTAIAEAFPQAEVFGFNSTYDQCYVYPLQQGYMLGKLAKSEGFRHGGNTDCSALLFMEQQMQGDYEGSLAVIISDGAPNSPSPLQNRHLHAHTKSVSHRLYEQGLRFVSVLVGNYADQTYYPSDVAVQLNSVADMQKVGEAIARIGQTFN